MLFQIPTLQENDLVHAGMMLIKLYIHWMGRILCRKTHSGTENDQRNSCLILIVCIAIVHSEPTLYLRLV